MKATLTVSKSELLGKLQARIAEIETNGRYARERQAITEALENRGQESAEAFAGRVTEYYAAILDGLRNGTITVQASGKLVGSDIPTKPVKGKQSGYERWSREQLERQLETLKRWLDNELKPLRTSIELLEMAQGDTIQIDAGDYQQLLTDLRF